MKLLIKVDNLNSKVHVHVPMRVDPDSLSMTLPLTLNFISHTKDDMSLTDLPILYCTLDDC